MRARNLQKKNFAGSGPGPNLQARAYNESHSLSVFLLINKLTGKSPHIWSVFSMQNVGEGGPKRLSGDWPNSANTFTKQL